MLLNNTQGTNTNAACLDLVSDSLTGGPVLQTAANATRIAYDGLKFCKNAFSVTSSGAADVAFIMDNTGSMQWGDPHFCSFPGDPTFFRDDAVKRGMKALRDSAKIATAGFISFKGPDTTGIEKTRLQSLLEVSQSNPNSATNLATLQSKVIADSGRKPVDSCNRSLAINTDWYPSFNLALSWFGNASLVKSQNPAIILISDGAVDDYYTKLKPLVLAGKIPAVYGVHLGDSLDNQGRPDQASVQLRELTELTGGNFFRVRGGDTVTMKNVMDTIIHKLVSRPTPPSRLTVTNTTTGQTSVARPPVLGSDGNFNITLDSGLALQQSGTNRYEVAITLASGVTQIHPVRVQASLPLATIDGLGLNCYDPATLTASPLSPGYSIQLTRSPSELTNVTVSGIASEGDLEAIFLPLTSSAGVNDVNKSVTPYPFNGTTSTHFSNNGTLETDANGRVFLRWVHPRDPRDSALYEIPGPAGSVTLDRLVDVVVSHGARVTTPVANPVVIYRGVSYTQINNKSTRINNPGKCRHNCAAGAGTASSYTDMGTEPNAPGFVIGSRYPFRYSLYVYDHLGRFVNKAVDSITAAEWQQGPDTGHVVVSLVPVSHNGQQIGTGVYILKATITTISGGTAVTSKFQKQFGYIEP